MVNRYGQTDLTQALLAQGTSPNPYKTGLGQAARLGGIALAEWGKRKKADENRSALADALAGMNSGSLTGEGPTTDAAGRAPIGDPQLMARLFSSGDPASMAVAQALFNRSMQPAPEPDIRKGADGYLYDMRTKQRALPGVVKQADPYNLSPGQQRFDGNNNLIASVPPTPKELSPREKAFSNLTPEQQVQHFLKPAATVNNNNTQQTAEDKKWGEYLVSNFAAIDEAGNNARAQSQLIRQAQIINDNPTGKEGFPLPSALKQKAGNVIVALGFDPDKIPGLEGITNGQQFEGIVKGVVLEAMQAQKGPQTESDRRLIEQTVASLSNTPEARAFLLDSAQAANDMKIMKQDFWQQFRDENGTFNGAARKWRETFGKAGMVRKHPKTGEVLFLPAFLEAVKAENPDASTEQMLALWGSYE